MKIVRNVDIGVKPLTEVVQGAAVPLVGWRHRRANNRVMPPWVFSLHHTFSSTSCQSTPRTSVKRSVPEELSFGTRDGNEGRRKKVTGWSCRSCP